MTTGAIAGIAIGATLLLLGGVGLFWAYHRKQKYGDRLDSANGRKSITPPLVGGYPHYYEGKNSSLPADWELRAQQPSINANYYDRMEKYGQSGLQMGHAYNPSYPGFQTAYGPHSTLPTHPAYMPRVASRSTSRNDTPSPPPIIKSNRPDAYTVNAYLNAAAAPTTTTTMPAVPTITTTDPSNNTALPYLPPPQPQPQPHPYHPLALPPTTTIIPRGAAPHRAPTTTTTKPFFPGGSAPPPPPPPPSQAPRLSMPTVPKVRKPTKYAPPNLVVASPAPSRGYGSSDSERDEVLSIGLSMPEEQQGPPRWEQESRAGYGLRTGTPPDQLAADRRRRRVTEFQDID